MRVDPDQLMLLLPLIKFLSSTIADADAAPAVADRSTVVAAAAVVERIDRSIDLKLRGLAIDRRLIGD